MIVYAFNLLSILLQPNLYLDPGSGSILLQIILAAILGTGVVARSQWAKIKSIFKGKDQSSEDQDDEE